MSIFEDGGLTVGTHVTAWVKGSGTGTTHYVVSLNPVDEGQWPVAPAGSTVAAIHEDVRSALGPGDALPTVADAPPQVVAVDVRCAWLNVGWSTMVARVNASDVCKLLGQNDEMTPLDAFVCPGMVITAPLWIAHLTQSTLVVAAAKPRHTDGRGRGGLARAHRPRRERAHVKVGDVVDAQVLYLRRDGAMVRLATDERVRLSGERVGTTCTMDSHTVFTCRQ